LQGIELLVRHSFAPNRLHYCGDDDYSSRIQQFIQSRDPTLGQTLKKEYTTFRAAFGYVKTIAESVQKNPFDFEVAEAYWIGNALLDHVSSDILSKLFLTRFSAGEYLGSELAAEMAAQLPAKIYPHHSFHVLYLHFLSGKVPVTLPNINHCLILPAKVLDVSPGKLTVEKKPFEIHNGDFRIGKPVHQEIDRFFSDPIQTGDWVSVHWNTYCMTLTPLQKENLEKYTAANLALLNAASIFS